MAGRGGRSAMLLSEILKVALESIRVNKLRSFLTMLGIIIGIGAVITMVALGEGAQRQVEERLQGLGTNVLTVRPGRHMFGGVDRGSTRLTTDDAEALRLAGPQVKRVSPELERRQQVEYGRANANLSVVGVWPEYFPIQNVQLAVGRLFTAGEERGRRRLAVIGSAVGERMQLGSSAELVGQNILVRGIPFEVIGVLEEKGSQGWDNPDERLYIPLSTAQFRVIGSEYVRSISVQASSARDMDAAIAEIDRLLRREHRIPPGEDADFSVRNMASLMTTFQETTQTFTFLLAGIAAISLLVGGIGIMNIMLVSVTERTREIGIRKALGARRRHILLQFLIESVVLCVAGGILGTLFGWGGATLLRNTAGWETAVAPEAVVLAFGFAALVGIFFGLWPARRAALLDPIESLRYE
ncbi:MAG: ABC transporter permease [Gemmatimonadota bacterium]